MPKASIIYPSTIVDYKNNQGWHKNGKRAYRRAVETIYRCLPLYREARLYHLCFEELDGVERLNEDSPHKTNIAMLHALVQMAEREGIKCEWFAAREKADTTKKDHLHVFMLIDAYGIKVAKLFNQFEDGRVQQFCKAHGVKFGIFNPKDRKGIHGRNVYMALPYQGPGNKQTELGTQRLEDALVWLSYLGKARSKPADDDKDGQIFPASRPKRAKKLDSPSAPQAEKEVIAVEADSKPLQGDSKPSEWVGIKLTPEPHQEAINASETHKNDKGNDLKLTPAQNYLSTLYENAVDSGMDVESVRLYLLEQGIKRSPAQVAWELEEKYGFLGYASRHPAPQKPDTRMLDALIDRTPLKAKAKVLGNAAQRFLGCHSGPVA